MALLTRMLTGYLIHLILALIPRPRIGRMLVKMVAFKQLMMMLIIMGVQMMLIAMEMDMKMVLMTLTMMKPSI